MSTPLPRLRHETVPLGRKLTVVIADDYEIIRVAASRILMQNGAQVSAVEDGKETIKTLQTIPSHVDIALIDLTLPDTTGVELFRLIRRVSPKTKVILMSGAISEDDKEKILGYGIDALLPKPFGAEMLVNAVGAVCETMTTKMLPLRKPVKKRRRSKAKP